MVDRPSPDSIRATAGLGRGPLHRSPTRLRQRLRPAAHWMAAALALGLAACGNNDDDAAPQPAPADLSIINAANATQVAGEAAQSISVSLIEFTSLVVNTLPVSFSTAPPRATTRSRLLRVAPAGGGVRPLAVSTNTQLCATSGQFLTTESQAVDNKLTVGDFVEKQFNACVEDGTETVGKLREVVTAVNATDTVFNMRGEFTGFGTTDADGVTVLLSGPYDATIDRTDPAAIKSSKSSDKAINVERRLKQQANAVYSLEALKRSIQTNFAAGAIVITLDYTLNGSFPQLGAARFQVNTVDNLSGRLADGAATGTIKVAGAGGSKLLMTFLGDDVDTIRVDLDANGDGTVDQTQTLTFEALLKLAQ